MFYRIVEDPSVHHGEDNVDKLKDGNLVVMFVVSREYKWYNKKVPNDLVSNYKKKFLVLCHPPPINVSGIDFYNVDNDSARWFSKSLGGWSVTVAVALGVCITKTGRTSRQYCQSF